jgi:ATP-dependent Zn protease
MRIRFSSYNNIIIFLFINIQLFSSNKTNIQYNDNYFFNQFSTIITKYPDNNPEEIFNKEKNTILEILKNIFDDDSVVKMHLQKVIPFDSTKKIEDQIEKLKPVMVSILSEMQKEFPEHINDFFFPCFMKKWLILCSISSLAMPIVRVYKTYLAPFINAKFNHWYRKFLFKISINPQKSKIKWNEIIGMEEIKEQLKKIYNDIKEQKQTKKLQNNNHILFYGPPGNGKTFVAQAFANKLNIPYFYIPITKLFENQDSINLIFERLIWYKKKYNTPIIVFIDEVDLIIPSRKQKTISAKEKQQLQNFLTSIDGSEFTNGILIITSTNNKDTLDAALLRDGRIGIHIEFTNPNEEDIKKLFIEFAKKFNVILASDLDYDFLIQKTKNSSIAKIRRLVKTIADQVEKISNYKVFDNDTLYNFFN